MNTIATLTDSAKTVLAAIAKANAKKDATDPVAIETLATILPAELRGRVLAGVLLGLTKKGLVQRWTQDNTPFVELTEEAAKLVHPATTKPKRTKKPAAPKLTNLEIAAIAQAVAALLAGLLPEDKLAMACMALDKNPDDYGHLCNGRKAMAAGNLLRGHAKKDATVLGKATDAKTRILSHIASRARDAEAAAQQAAHAA